MMCRSHNSLCTIDSVVVGLERLQLHERRVEEAPRPAMVPAHDVVIRGGELDEALKKPLFRASLDQPEALPRLVRVPEALLIEEGDALFNLFADESDALINRWRGHPSSAPRTTPT